MRPKNMLPSDPDAERRTYCERAEGLRALAAETADAAQQELLLLLAKSYEDLAGPLPEKQTRNQE